MKQLTHLQISIGIATFNNSILCFVDVAIRFNYTRPILSLDSSLDIVAGRHPIQEHIVENFIENDTRVSDTRGILLSGPNASGKSIYLKQVALIIYMAQIGSFVPAKSATICLCDKILTRIQTRESVSKTSSSFMIDLNQISIILRNYTERSLVIIDEFGKGTESSNGIGLFCAVLENLVQSDHCPLIFCATHFHEIFAQDLFSSHLLEQKTMEIVQVGDGIDFLYR